VCGSLRASSAKPDSTTVCSAWISRRGRILVGKFTCFVVVVGFDCIVRVCLYRQIHREGIEVLRKAISPIQCLLCRTNALLLKIQSATLGGSCAMQECNHPSQTPYCNGVHKSFSRTQKTKWDIQTLKNSIESYQS
jgi:hypothetical protein